MGWIRSIRRCAKTAREVPFHGFLRPSQRHLPPSFSRRPMVLNFNSNDVAKHNTAVSSNDLQERLRLMLSWLSDTGPSPPSRWQGAIRHDALGTTSIVTVWSLILTGVISSAGMFRYSATDATTREYHTVAVTVTGPGAMPSGSDQL